SRPVFRDGVVDRINTRIALPSPTLNVQATSLEWGQGAIINSTSRAHFALQGEGFFVLTDGHRYYLSRDGEFHWDGQGYLVNSGGLRVVSSGQDYVRFGRGDGSDIFNPEGQSQELARYGDKSLMIVDVGNRDGLRFSRYGSTVFEVDGDLPLRVRNALNESMDGLTFLYNDPKQRTYVDAPETPGFVAFGAGIDSDFSIDFGGNGVFNFNRPGGPLGGAMFDPTIHTIQHVVDAINDYGLDNNTNVTASYDAGTDRLTIINIPEPKVNNPNFGQGNFAIDFGDNGLFTYRDFNPYVSTIQSILDAINAYGASLPAGRSVTAVYNDVTDQFTITNTIPGAGNNEITFDGANGDAMARFMQMPVSTASTGAGAQALPSTVPIDRNPPSPNPFADISAQDVGNLPLARLYDPLPQIVFGGANGPALLQFFRLNGVSGDTAYDPINNFTGRRLQSSRDIDNSHVLTSGVPGEHDLDILAADVAIKSFMSYITTTDTTYPGFDFSGPPPRYIHDQQNGLVISDGTLNNGHGLLAISQAQRTDAFEMVIDFHTNSNMLELHFGYDQPEQIDSGGFSLYYNTTNGNLDLVQRSRDPNVPPLLIDSRPLAMPAANVITPQAHRLSSTLTKSGLLSLSIDGAPPAVFNLAGFSQQQSGYLSIGHQGGRLELTHLYADFKSHMNTQSTGEMVSLSITPYAAVEIREGHQSRERTRVVQSALESSTASLTEYVPMLSLAQKVFASLSKIISISNSITDDMNSLIR
ncbi:MAG: hypothetical protein CVV27_12150, partial [Candidatus Melainabacteria bacterium HGW-Melainabacteria-1]